MAFSTNIFLFAFLPLTLLGYYLIRKDLRNPFLLAASLAFFAWAEVRALPVLLAVILLSYCAAFLIGKAKTQPLSKLALALAIALDAGILVYFKYANFFIGVINRIPSVSVATRQILLPVGISFFVFQSISYMVDVYRKKIPPQKNLLEVGLYFAFFAKLTQGPIMRYGDMAEDLRGRAVDLNGFSDGVCRFVIGLAKKLVIADVLGAVADPIFALDTAGLNAALAWGGIFAYTLQIYFDFSGYSDMAIGLGKMFGFRIMENFNYPYISTSITEFWRRWHISLSSWFKDYVYIPLGGNRRGNQYFNLSVVFLLTGLWHGAAWTFILWGVFHGCINIVEKLLTKKGLLQKIPSPVRWLLTTLLVMVGWVFFRADSLSGAVAYLAAMFGMGDATAVQFRLRWFFDNKVVFVSVLGVLAAIPWKQFFPKVANQLQGTYLAITVRFVSIALLLAVCVMLAMTSTYTSFIYFQF